MNSGATLTMGSTGSDVRRLQIIFVMTKLLDVSGIDGIFGPKTQDAVKSFQQGSNLTADGVVGPMTWKALPADPQTPRLARGSTGSAVSALQKGLLTFGGANSATDPSAGASFVGIAFAVLAACPFRGRAEKQAAGNGPAACRFRPHRRPRCGRPSPV